MSSFIINLNSIPMQIWLGIFWMRCHVAEVVLKADDGRTHSANDALKPLYVPLEEIFKISYANHT